MQQRRRQDGGGPRSRDMEPYHDIVSSVFEHNVDEMERILRAAARVRDSQFCLFASISYSQLAR